MTDTRLYDVEGIAAYLGVTARFIYERTAPSCEHPMPHFKIGKFIRFRIEEVEKWLQDQAR